MAASSGGGSPSSSTNVSIDLTKTGDRSKRFDVSAFTNGSAHIVTGHWASAVVEAKWSIDGANYFSFATPITFNSSNPARHSLLQLHGVNFLIFEVTTASGGESTDTALSVYFDRAKIKTD